LQLQDNAVVESQCCTGLAGHGALEPAGGGVVALCGARATAEGGNPAAGIAWAAAGTRL
jgi:hypothetical protein